MEEDLIFKPYSLQKLKTRSEVCGCQNSNVRVRFGAAGGFEAGHPQKT
jgi:hypothetical protein